MKTICNEKNFLLLFFLSLFFNGSYASNVFDKIEQEELAWLEKALAGEVSVDAFNVDNETPLTIAIDRGEVEKAFQLLEKGANVNISRRHNETPLIIASYWGHLELVRELLRRGADPNIAHNGAFGTNINANTGLYYAVRRGHYEIVLALIEAGVDLTLENHDRTILLMARREVTETDKKILKLLIARGVKNNIKKDYVETLDPEIQDILNGNTLGPDETAQ